MTEQTYQLLVADDDADFRRAVCEIFAPFFRLIEADSGEEALELAAREEVHLALFDMHMKRLTGLETIAHLRQLKKGLPCILMSAALDDQIMAEAQLLETFSVLMKPVSRQVLRSTIELALFRTYGWPQLKFSDASKHCGDT